MPDIAYEDMPPALPALSFSLAVIIAAQEIVSKPPTKFGYGDIGEALVAHLRGEKTAEEALESLRLLNEDYERQRRPRPTLPVIIFAGYRASMPVVRKVLNIPDQWTGWINSIKIARDNRDLDQLRGLRGPDVWWVDWQPTQEMRNFAAVHEFKRATVEEVRAAVDTYIGASK